MIAADQLKGAGQAGWAALVADPARALLAFDYDGTLAPIVLDPAAAVPQPGAREALGKAAVVFRTVAIVSGRAAAGVVDLLDLAAPDAPTAIVVGVHGREWWTRANGSRAAPPHPGLEPARAELLGLLDVLSSGARVEDKGHSLAVHFRGCADPAAAAAAAHDAVAQLARARGLELLRGRLVLELIGPGQDKGTAVRALAEAAGAVCYVGDDLADLAAFAAVDALRTEGVPGLKVAVGNPESPDPARQADLVLADPAAVVEFLGGLIAVASRGL